MEYVKKISGRAVKLTPINTCIFGVFFFLSNFREFREKKIPVISLSLSNLFSYQFPVSRVSVSLHSVLIRVCYSFNLLVLFAFHFQFCFSLVYFILLPVYFNRIVMSLFNIPVNHLVSMFLSSTMSS
jgi:hypothetical protein